MPVALIFDYPDSNVDPDLVNKIMYTFDVFITFRQKSRQSTLCVVIKGIEKYITNVYEARHQLLKLSGPRIIAEIPPTYFFSDEKTKERNGPSLVSLLQHDSSTSTEPLSFLPLSTWSSPPQLNAMDMGLRPSPFPLMHLTPTNSSSMPDIFSAREMHNVSNGDGASKSFMISPKNCSDIQSSGYHSMNCSFMSLENPNLELENEVISSNLLRKRRSIDVPYADHHSSTLNDSFTYNFDPRVVSAYNAMRGSPKGELRTPKSGWQGLGVSRTSPAPLNQSKSTQDFSWIDSNVSSKLSMTTSLLDSVPRGQRSNLLQYNDVASILSCLGLDHYTCMAKLYLILLPHT